MKDIKNIIFDLDGTIIDSMPIWKNVGKDFLINNNIEPPHNLEEIFKSKSFTQSNEYFRKELGLKKNAEEMIAEITSMVKGRYERDIPIKPFAREFLLQERNKGTKMCILTASEEEFVVPALKRLGIYELFQDVFTCTGLGMSKSEENIFNFVAEKVSVAKGETAVFEDAVHAVINAKKAGFYVVAVEDLSAKNDRETIMNVADRYIQSYKELL